MENLIRLKRAVNWYHQNGFRVFPLSAKQPVMKYSILYDRPPTIAELRNWFTNAGTGIAILTGYSGYICIDCDSKAEARWWYENRPRTEMMSRTNSGAHYWYKNADVEVRNRRRISVDGMQREIDIRGWGGYALGPPSVHPSGGQYERVGTWNLDDVPKFDPSWIDTPVEKPREILHSADPQEAAKVRAIKYISHIKSVSGRGGHNEAYRAAACLIERGLNYVEAEYALQNWNATNSQPPWTEFELKHKLDSAWANLRGQS